jgi:hypothetical protein
MIGRHPAGAIVSKYGYALFNERPGEYTKYFGELGLGANASSAMKKLQARLAFC